MRKFIAYLSIFLVVACSTSKQATTEQAGSDAPPAAETLDRSVVPPPGPAPEFQLGDYQYFELENGLRVYVVQNDKLPRVSYSLEIDRDVIYEGDKTGYVSIAGQLMGRGTSTRTKAEIDETVDFIGASFSTFSNGMYGSSLTKHSDVLLETMHDVLMNPSFPQEELDKIIKITKSGIVADRDDPKAIIRNISGIALFGKDHPYGEMVTEETLDKITREDIVEYYKKFWSPKKGYLAIVGDIDLDEAKRNAEKYFSSWTGDELPELEYELPEFPEQNSVILVDRPQSVQSEIRITYPIEFKANSPDYFAARLMNQILGVGFSSRLLQNLREDKGYTYGTFSGLPSNELISRFYAGAGVRNEVTDSAVHEFLYELDRIVSEGITEEELAAKKAYITGSFARTLEDPKIVAGFAINTAVKGLPEDFYHNYLKSLNAVTLEEVNAAARKYIKPENAYIVVVGKAAEVEEGLRAFGPVIRMDVDGNVVDQAKLNAALAGISPQAVVDEYIDAIGGADQLMKVGNQVQVWEMSAYGQSIEMRSVKTVDGKFRTDVIVGGTVQQSIVSNGEDVVTMAMGTPMPMPEEEKAAELINNRLFPELHYARSDVKLKLSGMEKINGKDAYVISIIYPSGKESQAYFEKETGLKIRETTSMDTPQGSLTQISDYSDYREAEGVLYPYKTSITVGPQSLDSEMVKLENNTSIPSGTFDLEN